MECSIYDINLNRIAIIPTWISLLWTENYIDTSEFVLETAYSAEIVGLLSIGNYILLSGRIVPMVIQTLEITSTSITASGVSARDYILGARASNAVITDQNAEGALLDLVDTMAPWPHLDTATAKGLPDTYVGEFCGGSLLDYCINLGNATDIGTRIVYDKSSKRLVFECYKPNLNVNAIFSTKYGNMQNLVYDISMASYKNTALVAGLDAREMPVMVLAGDTAATGDARREAYVDASSVRTEDGESLDAYRSRLVKHGVSALAGMVEVRSISFDIASDAVAVGDLVRCSIPEIGYKANVRIAGITEKSQKNKITRSITLGTPVMIGG